MVTFLVCLVVVGGASIIILRVTLEDVFKGATDDPASLGGTESTALEGTASSSVPPTEQNVTDRLGREPDGGKADGGKADGGEPDGTRPDGTQSDGGGAPESEPAATQPVATVTGGPQPAATEPVATDPGGSQPADDGPWGADPERTRSADAHQALPRGGPSSPVPAAPPGRTTGAGLERPEQQVVWRDEAPTSAVLVEERPTEAHGRNTEAHTATTEAPAPVGPRRPAPRAPRPSFGRRLARRVLGGVKLLALLVVVGTLLALVLGAAAVLFTFAMRAAIGS